MLAQETTEAAQLERENAALRQALHDIACAGRFLLEAMPVAGPIPSALAQGPLLTITGLAEAALNQQ